MNIKAGEEYIAFLKHYLQADPDALAWVIAYTKYVHAIDDIIDGDNTSSEHIIRTFEFAAVIYSNVFYLRNLSYLYPLVKVVSNAYQDSVILEKSPEKWQRYVADGLRQHGNELILACVELVGGYDARREASMKLRDIAYRSHHNEIGEPI